MNDYTLLRLGRQGLEASSGKLNNVFAEKYNMELDHTFALAHGTPDYSRQDYQRVAFDSYRAYDRFLTEMRSEGVTVASAPIKLNGQYLAEIPREFTKAVTESSHNLINNFQTAQGTTLNITGRGEADVDNAFKAMHSTSYDKDDYEVIRFDSEKEWNDFASEMKSKNADFYVTKVNGERYVELAKESTVGTTSKSADQLVRDFEYKTFEKTEEPKEPTENAVSYNPISDLKLSTEVASHLDTLGDFIFMIDRVERFMQPYQTYKSEDKFFNTKLSHGEAQPSYNSRGNEKAVVLNESTVVINGKVVTDPEVRRRVLEQHHERFGRVDTTLANEGLGAFRHEVDGRVEIVGGAFATGLVGNENETLLKNTEAIAKSVYRQEYNAGTARTEGFWSGGFLDQASVKFNTEAIALSLVGSAVALSTAEVDILKKLLTQASPSEMDALTRLIHSQTAVTYRDRIAIMDAIKTYKENVVLSSGEMAELQKLGSKVALTEKERAMFTGSKETMRSLKNDLGLDFMKGGITGKDILKINEVFLARAEMAGFQFVRRNAKGVLVFDTKALRNLSDADLLKLNISRRTANFVADLNEKGAFGGMSSGNGALGYMLLSGWMRLADDDELSEAINSLRKASRVPRYTKSAVTSANQYKNAVVNKVNEARLKRAQKKGKTIKPKSTKGKKGTHKAGTTRPVDTELNAKYLAKGEKKFARAEKSKNSIFTRVKTAKNNAMSKLANSRAGKLFNSYQRLKEKFAKFAIKWGLRAFGGIVFLSMGIIIIIIAISFIQSLLLAPIKWIDQMLVPKSYDETVCYKLYEHLKAEEDVWLTSISDSNALYSFREDFKYGTLYQDYDEYISHFNSLTSKGVNPFWQVPQITNDYYISEFVETDSAGWQVGGSWSGALKVDVGANINEFGLKSAHGGYGEYISSENGHTSNIKDILGMVDVMYQFDMDNMYDGEGSNGLSGILGKSPAGVNWENFKNKTWGTIKWAFNNVVTAVGNFFGGDGEYTARDIYIGDTCSYKTIQNYATHLFETSHQNYFSYDVKYFPIKKKWEVTVNGKKITIPTEDIYQKDASALGFCVTPVTKKFPLVYDATSRQIIPAIKGSDGKYYSVAGTKFDVRLSFYDDTYTDKGKACLWDNMSSTKATLLEIKAIAGKDKCWKQANSDTSNSGKKSATGSWKTSESSAKESALNELKKIYNTYSKNPDKMGKSSYYLNSARTLFTDTHFELNKDWQKQVKYTVKKSTSAEGEEWLLYYWDTDYNAKLDEDNYTTSKSAGTDKNGDLRHVYEYYEVPKSYKIDEDLTDEELYRLVLKKDFKFAYSSDKDDEFRNELFPKNKLYYNLPTSMKLVPVRAGKWKTVYSTSYKATATSVLYKKVKTTYERNCKGHEFSYCGGHVNVHSQGIVFSTTNEQNALTGMYESEETIPIVKDLNLKTLGYEKLLGKHNNPENKVDYTSALLASTTGGVSSAYTDIQGSEIGNRGLNLFVKDDNKLGELDSGMKVRENYAKNSIRDIFDADCVLDKGDNIFPFGKDYKKYEGWTADNMTLVGMRVTQPWTDVYEFDIPYEMGQIALSTEDIKLITEALKEKYKGKLTSARLDTVKLALNFVGRGHYSEDHKEHAFLSKLCQWDNTSTVTRIRYDANCTAGNGEGFIKFLLNRAGKLNDVGRNITGWYHSGNRSDWLPADYIYRKGNREEINQLEFTVKLGKNSTYNKTHYSKILKYASDFITEKYLVYIGEVNKDITLSNGQTIKANVPITVDLSKNDGKGNIYLRCYEPENWYEMDGNTQYSWIMYPDRRVYLKFN